MHNRVLSIFCSVICITIFMVSRGMAAVPGIAAKSYVDSVAETITATISNKADKVIPDMPGNIAILDASGNIVDGGIPFDNLAWESEVSVRLFNRVSKTGDESVSGVKTFTDIPLIPTAELPTKQ